MAYDDELIAEIDEAMGWVEKDGSSPSKTARDLGYHCKFLDGPFSATAWCGPDGTWSVCVLSGIKCTLLAKSFAALESLYRKLQERATDAAKWKPYYKAMWRRRYRKWCCSKERSCECQLCRMERGRSDELKGGSDVRSYGSVSSEPHREDCPINNVLARSAVERR